LPNHSFHGGGGGQLAKVKFVWRVNSQSNTRVDLNLSREERFFQDRVRRGHYKPARRVTQLACA